MTCRSIVALAASAFFAALLSGCGRSCAQFDSIDCELISHHENLECGWAGDTCRPVSGAKCEQIATEDVCTSSAHQSFGFWCGWTGMQCIPQEGAMCEQLTEEKPCSSSTEIWSFGINCSWVGDACLPRSEVRCENITDSYICWFSLLLDDGQMGRCAWDADVKACLTNNEMCGRFEDKKHCQAGTCKQLGNDEDCRAVEFRTDETWCGWAGDRCLSNSFGDVTCEELTDREICWNSSWNFGEGLRRLECGWTASSCHPWSDAFCNELKDQDACGGYPSTRSHCHWNHGACKPRPDSQVLV